jgi:ATP-dependent RNA helicase DDX41
MSDDADDNSINNNNNNNNNNSSSNSDNGDDNQHDDDGAAAADKPLVWVPLAQRKRQRRDAARRVFQQQPKKRVALADDDNEPEAEQQETFTAGPRAAISLLDQVALDLVQKAHETEADKMLKEEKELMKAFDEFKPLVSVQTAAAGIQYTEPIKRAWRAPRFVESLTPQQVDKIRANFHIITSGDDIPPPVTRFKDLKLPRCVLDMLANAGIARPTPIQMQGL